LDFAPSFTVQKVWDGRWALAVSVVVILLILDWMMETDHYSKKSMAKVAVYEE
jgi:hypothetical protein